MRCALLGMGLVLAGATVLAAAQTSEQPGVTVISINGVNSDPQVIQNNGTKSALESAVSEALVGTPLADQRITVKPVYNQNEPLFLDFLQAGAQAVGTDMRRLLGSLWGVLPVPPLLRTAVGTAFQGIDGVAYVLQPDLTKIVEEARAALAHGDLVILVPHSQGNYLANEAYRILRNGEDGRPPLTTNSVGIIAVATPTSFVAGGWEQERLTVQGDIITTVPGALRPTIPTGCVRSTDRLCHSFDRIYLKGRLRDAFKTRVQRVALALERPAPPPPAFNLAGNWTMCLTGYTSPPNISEARCFLCPSPEPCQTQTLDQNFLPALGCFFDNDSLTAPAGPFGGPIVVQQSGTSLTGSRTRVGCLGNPNTTCEDSLIGTVTGSTVAFVRTLRLIFGGSIAAGDGVGEQVMTYDIVGSVTSPRAIDGTFSGNFALSVDFACSTLDQNGSAGIGPAHITINPAR